MQKSKKRKIVKKKAIRKKELKRELYDLIIIGAGAAGLSAALYAGRYRLNTLVIGKTIGGVSLEAHWVENYPGFASITGLDLMEKFKEHALKFGAKIIEEEIISIKKKEKIFILMDHKKNIYECKSLIITTGMEKRKLGIPGEKEFLGKGVSYCATCDGPLFRNKTVAIVGGSDAAGVEALLLTEYAKKVYIIYRREQLRAEPVTFEKIKKNKKIEIIYKANVVEVRGKDFVTGVTLDSKQELKLDGLFIEIGGIPTSYLVKDIGVKLTEDGHIIVDETQETNVDYVFAAGDITNASNKFKQIITAASEGCLAALSAYKHVRQFGN